MSEESPRAIEAKRKQTYQEMPPDLKEVALKFERIEVAIAGGTVVLKYDIGLGVERVRADEGRYGTRAVERLGEYLGVSVSYLCDLGNLTKHFTQGEVKDLASRTLPGGDHLRLHHFLALMRIRDAADRQRMLDRVLEGGWSTRRLVAEIDSQGIEKRKVSRGGRRPARPTSPLAAAQSLAVAMERINRRAPLWRQSLIDAVAEMPPSTINRVLRAKVSAALRQVTAMKARLPDIAAGLQRSLERVDRIVAQRGAETALPPAVAAGGGRDDRARGAGAAPGG